ncbi:hypothetical protein [Erwinia phage phiEaP8]|uniref:Uncharacterized protein n=1 Tax=Erwinia phage phiEaP8 TaxID=2178928 RepID=A0A3G1QTR4_9CAUD|nr:hypothetical protein HYP64_gp41 [Erwinia phage phiEaP8]AWN06251.1 hypothetical protein [Erwinia phage phiEaP8]
MSDDKFVTKEFEPVAGISKSEEHHINIDSDGMVVMTTLDCTTGKPVRVLLSVSFDDLHNFVEGLERLVKDAMLAHQFENQSAVTKH